MVRNASRKLKFGVQSRFYPISTVGFRTFFPENFGQAYCALLKDFLLIIPPNENKGSIKFKYIQQKYCTIDNAYDHLLMILPAACFKVGVS